MSKETKSKESLSDIANSMRARIEGSMLQAMAETIKTAPVDERDALLAKLDEQQTAARRSADLVDIALIIARAALRGLV